MYVTGHCFRYDFAMDEITAANKVTEDLRNEMLSTQEKMKKYTIQLEEKVHNAK